MAKYDGRVAVGFGIQSAQGTYNATLDALTTTFAGDSSGTDEGLLLGTSGSGINGSGLSLTLGRKATEAQIIQPSLTRPLSLFEAREVTSLSFAFEFGSNRALTTAGATVDADFVPLVAIDAILKSLGMTSSVLTKGQRYRFSDATPPYLSIIAWVHTNRYKFQDCLPNTLTINFAAGKTPTAVVDCSVGAVQTVVQASIPTLSYGNQTTVTPKIVENVGFSWEHVRGFSTLQLAISQSPSKEPDSNLTDGISIEAGNREVTISTLMYGDNTGSNQIYASEQLLVTDAANLDPMFFQIGTATTPPATIADALKINVPMPVATAVTPTTIGANAAWQIEATASHTTANRELDIDFT